MSDPAKTLFGTGRVVAEGGNRPFLLDRNPCVWLIDAGSVDVFAVPLVEGKPMGARTHIFRVAIDEVLFGFESNLAHPIGLLAVGNAGTKLRHFAWAEFQALGLEPTNARALAGMIDRWIHSIYRGLSRAMLPKEFVTLEPEGQTRLSASAAARPLEGVTWIKLLQGSAVFATLDNWPWPQHGDCIPITPATWIQAKEDSVVVGADTLALVKENTVWSHLQKLHPLLIHWAAQNLSEMRQREEIRLEAKAEAGRHAIANAVADLSSSLQPDRADDLVLKEERDPLLAACQVLGKTLGFAFRAPAGYKTGRSDKDPLARIASASRLRLRRVVLAEDWWRRDCGPLLAYRKGNDRPVALLPASAGTYALADPGQRAREPIDEKSANLLKPMAYTFYRSFPNRVLNVWDVLSFGLQGSSKDLLTILLIGLAGGMLAMLTPIVTGVLFDVTIPGAERSQLLQVTLGLLVVAFASVVFEITRSIAILRVETRSDSLIQSAVWDRLLSLPLPFFRNYTAGDLAMRANGIGTIRQILSGAVLTTVLAGVFSVFNFALLFYYSVKLALLATVLVAVSLGAIMTVSLLRLKYQRPIMKIQGKIAGMVLQFITGITKLRVAGAEALAFAVWARAFSEETRLDRKTGAVWIGLNVFNTAYWILTTIVLFGAMAFWVESRMSTGAFLAFNAAFGGFIGTVLAMGNALLSLLDAVPIYERAKPILETTPEVDEERADPGELHGKIELSHILFRYHPDTPPVLNDLSFQVNPGEMVAIVGPSGAGKSTLFRLLLGFETPEAGSIYYDGIELAGLDVTAVRRQFGVVLQNAKLTPGSIFENIVGSSLLTLEDACEAARQAGLEEDIRQMPMGMHTVLSEGAGTLSGGQRQRLMIARAIVARPRILLFDEATSALDNHTQGTVSRSLEQLQATRIIIAHRLSTIMNAHRILVIQGGRLVQSGNYQELIQQPGVFADMAKRQLA